MGTETAQRVAVVVLALSLVTACGAEGDLVTDDTAPRPTVTATATPPATAGPGVASPSASATPAATAGAANDARSAFVSRANALCREFTVSMDELAEPQGLDDIPPWLEGFVAVMDDLNQRFRALPVPPPDARDVDTYLDGNEAQRKALADALPEVRAAAETDDPDRADAAMEKAFTTFGRIAAEQDSWARGYGLSDCVDPEDGSGGTAA